MKVSTDQVLGYYGIQSIFYENRVSKEWWNQLTDINKKEVLVSYIELNPHKKHLSLNLNNGDRYLVYLFNKYKIIKPEI